MHARYPLPRLWMLTDERQGEALWPALKALPRGSGVIVRHYSLDTPQRRKLFESIRTIAKARRLVLLLSDDFHRARKWRADGVYGGARVPRHTRLLCAAPVHTLAEIRRAELRNAHILLLSPLFTTQSHPGGRTLGRTRFAQLARSTSLPVIALGGVKSWHRRLMSGIGAYGWAGIDAFTM